MLTSFNNHFIVESRSPSFLILTIAGVKFPEFNSKNISLHLRRSSCWLKNMTPESWKRYKLKRRVNGLQSNWFHWPRNVKWENWSVTWITRRI